MAISKTKGVFLVSFGKRGYAFAAYNMAASIKAFNKDIQIAVLHDNHFDYLPNKSVFDIMIPLEDEIKTTNGRLDPAKVKILMYDYMPFEENLYLDVDGLALKDIEDLINILSEKEGFFYSIKMGEGGKEDSINYSHWATNEDVWNVFKLKETYTTIQSSVIYIKKGLKADKFFEKLKLNYAKGFHKAKLWGGTLPDELFYSGTLSQMGINPDMGIEPIFFGNSYDKRTYTQLEEDYYILSMFGNGKGRTLTKLRYMEWYDRLVKKFGGFKSNTIMNDKHLNN